MMCRVLLSDVEVREVELDRRQPPFESLTQVREQIHRELARLAEEAKKPTSERSWLAVREQLVAAAAVALRGCRDLGLSTKSEAITRDIPF